MTRDEFAIAVQAAIEDEATLQVHAEELADVLQAAQSVGEPRSAQRRAAVKALWTTAMGARYAEPAAVSVRRRVERIVRIREGAPATPKAKAKATKPESEVLTPDARITAILAHMDKLAEDEVSGKLTAEHIGRLRYVSEAAGKIRQAAKARGI